MRYVFSLIDHLPILQDYANGLVPELSVSLRSKLVDEQYRLWLPNLKNYLDKCLPSMTLNALISLAIYDNLAPTGKHMVNTYILLNDLWSQHIEAETNESDTYVGSPIGIDIRHFDDVCDVAALLANTMLDFIEQMGVLDYEYFIEICQRVHHQLSRVYRYGIEQVKITEVLISSRAVILTGEQTKFIEVF